MSEPGCGRACEEMERLREKLAETEKGAAELLMAIVAGAGGTLRVRAVSFVSLDTGCELHRRIDCNTGDIVLHVRGAALARRDGE